MNISIRKNSVYLDVTISHNNTVISLGLLDASECRELARTLEEAVDELTEQYSDEEVTP